MSFTVAEIKPNDFIFDKDKYYNNIELLKYDINKFINIKETSHDSMMELIINTINLTPESLGDTLPCYENLKNMYQLCFVAVKSDNEKTNELNLNEFSNNISSYLVIGKEKIIGTTVIINNEITDNCICKPSSVTLDDICNILYSKFIHKGIHVSTDNKITEFDYFDHPLEFIGYNEENLKNHPGILVPFLKFNIIAFFELNPKNNVINKKATQLIGKHKVNGDVIFILKETEFEFIDLTTTIFKKLLTISNILKERELREDETNEGQKINDLFIVNNKYTILDKRYNSYKDNCSYCQQELEMTNYTCTGCYRAKYHNNECRLKDWEIHKKECIYNKTLLNDQIKERLKEKEK